MAEPILKIEHLTKSFVGRRSLLSRKRLVVQAVRDVNMQVEAGSAVGVVGETGCGKSTLARMIMGIIPASEGRILFHGREVSTRTQAERRELYKKMQFVFQDPAGSLNPRKTVREILEMPMRRLLKLSKPERDKRVLELMDLVNLRPEYLERNPHEFSGGQAQRIGIARALAARPELLVLDEPVSALDVSIQAQILSLLKELRERLKLTYVFISHDLAVVEYLCNSIAVMYLGTLAEYGPAHQVFGSPRHPYTHVLLASVPEPGRRNATAVRLTGELPSPANPPPGCPFSSRCYRAEARCSQERPPLIEQGPGRTAACFFSEDLPPPPRLEEPAKSPHRVP